MEECSGILNKSVHHSLPLYHVSHGTKNTASGENKPEGHATAEQKFGSEYPNFIAHFNATIHTITH